MACSFATYRFVFVLSSKDSWESEKGNRGVLETRRKGLVKWWLVTYVFRKDPLPISRSILSSSLRTLKGRESLQNTFRRSFSTTSTLDWATPLLVCSLLCFHMIQNFMVAGWSPFIIRFDDAILN